jgi:hypothetical protein
VTAPVLKTKAEQKLEYLKGLHRPLTDRESDELRRAMHAVYERERRLGLLAMNRREELALLEQLRIEAATPEWYPT